VILVRSARSIQASIRNLKNVTIKIDPLQIKAIKKLSTMKAIPYQTLIRHWLAESIKAEMDSILK
jgi:predicted DNA binding CopG/RHH family protein